MATNRSEAIREILAQNSKAPTKEIIATLAQRGIKVNAPLIYIVKRRMKRRRRKQLRKRVAQITGNASGNANPVALILKVKGLAAEAGGMGNLKKLVEVLSE